MMKNDCETVHEVTTFEEIGLIDPLNMDKSIEQVAD
jgi:hypothetical protein